mmetsp:Transcript_56172/g.99980  ORF Transcript_56172/g.99980 Transcript_56172/m.99980 type:complete len:227 (+) Transcript_56172:516-1196(+)
MEAMCLGTGIVNRRGIEVDIMTIEAPKHNPIATGILQGIVIGLMMKSVGICVVACPVGMIRIMMTMGGISMADVGFSGVIMMIGMNLDGVGCMTNMMTATTDRSVTEDTHTTNGMTVDSIGVMTAMVTVSTNGGMTRTIQTADGMTIDKGGLMANANANRIGMMSIRMMNGMTRDIIGVMISTSIVAAEKIIATTKIATTNGEVLMGTMENGMGGIAMTVTIQMMN